jgi:hypothetical protein
MWPKNKAATTSAAEQQELGWPLPAAVVAVMESIRNWLAMPDNASSIFVFIQLTESLREESQKEKAEKQVSPALCAS